MSYPFSMSCLCKGRPPHPFKGYCQPKQAITSKVVRLVVVYKTLPGPPECGERHLQAFSHGNLPTRLSFFPFFQSLRSLPPLGLKWRMEVTQAPCTSEHPTHPLKVIAVGGYQSHFTTLPTTDPSYRYMLLFPLWISFFAYQHSFGKSCPLSQKVKTLTRAALGNLPSTKCISQAGLDFLLLAFTESRPRGWRNEVLLIISNTTLV